jgi:hypothetical protein
VEPLLVNIVSDALECQDVDADVNASYANSAIILSSCLEALARSKSSSWLAAVDLVSWTRNAVEKWGDNAHVLQAYVSLLEAPYVCSLDVMNCALTIASIVIAETCSYLWRLFTLIFERRSFRTSKYFVH